MNKLDLKLNLGSGPTYVSGYVCIDKSPTLLLSKVFLGKTIVRLMGISLRNNWDKRIKYQDVRRLPYKQNSVDAIYSSHLLEHLFYSDAVKVLNECFRILKPGGSIRLALPDYDEILKRYILNIDSDAVKAIIDFEHALLSWPLVRPSFLERTKQFVFGQLHVHKWHPVQELVRFNLHEVGFIEIVGSSFKQSKYFNLEDLEIRHDDTFYLEARKPA